MPKILECQNIEVRYGFKKAVKSISFVVERGQSVALVGKNGAGKTSTLKALIGYVPLRRGNIQIMGRTPSDWRIFETLGFAPETGTPPEYLSAAEYLKFIAKLKLIRSKENEETISELLSVFDLEPEKKIREYSKGMKRRLVLAQAFVGMPALVILDEPLNGLDPVMIMRLRDWDNQCRKRGMTVIYSSHILSEVEKCCDRLILIHQGEVLVDQLIDEIKAENGGVEQLFYEKVGKS